MEVIALLNNPSDGRNLVEKKCREVNVSIEVLERLIHAWLETQGTERRTRLFKRFTDIIDALENQDSEERE